MSTNPINILLPRLKNVKRMTSSTNSHKYIACCPAHDDRTPSLSIKELNNGQVLIHCFAGCSCESIVNSIGLTLSDLFPDSFNKSNISYKQNIDREKTIISIYLSMRSKGEYISPIDVQQVERAVSKLEGLGYGKS